MMKSPAPTPSEIFDRWLEQQPDSARVVLACDSDRLIAESRALDPESVTDSQGRKWSLAIFRGDHVQFRKAFRTSQVGGRTIIGLLGPSQPDAIVDISLLADVLSFVDGTPLDLSLAKYLGKFCPQISFPSRPLRHYRDALLARKEELAAAGKKITARWGKPDSWGLPQVAAMVLLAHAPGLSLEDVWPDSDDPAEFVAQGLDLLLARPELASLRSTVLDLFKAAALPAIAESRSWFQPAPEDLAAFLVLFADADNAGLQNAATQLVGAGLLPADTDWNQLAPLASKIISLSQARDTWKSIQSAADPYLTPKRVARLLALTHRDSSDAEMLGKAFAESPVLPMRRAILGRMIAALLAKPVDLQPTVAALTEGNQTLIDESIRAGIAFLEYWNRIEKCIVEAVPVVANPAALLKQIDASEVVRADVDIAGMHHAIEKFGDDELVETACRLLYGDGGSDMSPGHGSLKDRLRNAVQRWDEVLAGFIRKSPSDFCDGGWCSVGYIHERLRQKVDSLSVGDGDGRVWVLVFDGMRYDTWRLVVRPLLAEHFQIVDERALFTVPPSYTTVARTSLLAGRVPGKWQAFQGQTTSDESVLAAVNLGLNQQEAKTKFRLVKEAETIKARSKLGATDKDARLVNVLIYGISDDCHDFYGDLSRFNQKIRTDITGDSTHGVAGILDDLLRRVKPEDEIVLVSDHGFTELLDADGVEVKASAGTTGKESIFWRYVLGVRPEEAPDAVAVSVSGKEHHLAVGRKWFRREGTHGKPRYSHGGISIAEMTVPAVSLRIAVAKSARVVIDALTDQIEILEDDWREEKIAVANRGTLEAAFEITAVTNLGESVLSETGSLRPGESREISFRLCGKYRETIQREVDHAATLRAVSFRLTYRAGTGKPDVTQEVKVSIPITVVPKPTKLDTEALSGLDDI